MRKAGMRPFESSMLVVALTVTTSAFAGDALPSTSEARASMPYSGMAVMQEDGAISLHLRLSSDGKDVDDTLTYKTTDRGYDNVLRHLGGLNPGESKPFSPWKD
jgi:hypothetical protein